MSEFTVRQLRSFSAVMSGGYSARESREDHARCVELCEPLGLGPELLPSLWSAGPTTARCDLVQADRVCRAAAARAPPGSTFPRASWAGVSVASSAAASPRRAQLMRVPRASVGAAAGRAAGRWPLPNDPFVASPPTWRPTLWMTGDPERRATWPSARSTRAPAARVPLRPVQRRLPAQPPGDDPAPRGRRPRRARAAREMSDGRAARVRAVHRRRAHPRGPRPGPRRRPGRARRSPTATSRSGASCSPPRCGRRTS